MWLNEMRDEEEENFVIYWFEKDDGNNEDKGPK